MAYFDWQGLGDELRLARSMSGKDRRGNSLK